MYEVLGKDISMLHVAGTPAGVFDGFLTGFCASGCVEWLLKSSLYPFLAQPLSCPAGAVHNTWASSSAAGTPWGLPWCHRGPVLPSLLQCPRTDQYLPAFCDDVCYHFEICLSELCACQRFVSFNTRGSLWQVRNDQMLLNPSWQSL